VNSVELEAPAKLNLFLEVVGRRPDGYHEIDSVFAEIDLCDRVRLERADSMSLTVEGEPVPSDNRNLAWRAADALGCNVCIQLIKNIPPGAGLGGGSSDAAAVLKGVNRLYALGLEPAKLAGIAVGLGADVPFFLHGGLARCRGIGEKIEILSPAPSRSFLLLLPDLEISTAAVYGALKPGLTAKPSEATVFCRDYLGSGTGPARYHNRLQAAAEELDPRLRGVRTEAERRYGRAFCMTGSGSAYFAELRDNEKQPPIGYVTEEGIEVRAKVVSSGPRR
jgi:4-diphosphocytidyl-2-C-methyl-D-erythritol kinase